VRVDAGEVTVEVQALGYAPMQRVVAVAPQARVHAVFAFELPSPSLPVDSKESGTPATRTQLEPRSPARHTAGWIALGSAGGFLAIGVAGLVTREWEARIWNSSQCSPTVDKTRADRCGTNRDLGFAAQTTAIVALSGAGVAAAVSGVLLLGGSSRPSAPTHVACGIAGLGLACGGTF
jgi:hypothetical protein